MSNAINTPPAVVVSPVPASSVVSPRLMLSDVVPFHDGGGWRPRDPLAGWSATDLRWENEPGIGLRWNGGPGQPCGAPQSRGLPIWYVVPNVLGGPLKALILQLKAEALPEPTLAECAHAFILAARRSSPDEVEKVLASLR